MPETLKEKTVHGLMWSFIDNFSKQGITFIVGIILARLLTPTEFGLIGMITVVISLTKSFIDSGFSSALIRKTDCTQDDYSTVFYFNLVVGLFFYFLLFFSASFISNFYNEPQLTLLVKVLSIVLVIDSFSIIQTTILTKRIDFKLQTKISVIANIFSGIIGIIMALQGYGVWSLVVKTIIQHTIISVLLWIWNKWRPIVVFSYKSFKELFGFGSKLLISGLLNTIYHNIYYLVIGKYFSAQELGYFTRANQFNTLPSSNITLIINRVSYPVLAQLNDNPSQLKSAYKKLIKSTMLITFVLMFGLAAIAEPLIITLIGEKWSQSIIYLQLLCFVGMFFPLHSLNLNILKVKGRSDIFLKLEVIKKIMAIPVIIIGVLLGIKFMIMGMIVNSMLAYFLNSYYSGRFIGYSSLEQIKDILPAFLLAIAIGISVFSVGYFLQTSMPVKLLIQVGGGALLTFGLVEALNMKDYKYIKQIVQDKLLKGKQ